MSGTTTTRLCVCGAPQDADGRCTGLLSAQESGADRLVDQLAEQLWDHFSTSGWSFRTMPDTEQEAWQAEVACFRRTASELLVAVLGK